MEIEELKMTDKRYFYDTTWFVKTNVGCVDRLTRSDDETYGNLKSLIENCSDMEEVGKLDMRNTIYYD